MILQNCNITEFLSRIAGKKLVCFGAGEWAEMLSRDFPKYKLEKHFRYIADNNSALWGSEKNINGSKIEVCSPDKLVEEADKNTVICITSGVFFAEIFKHLDAIPKLKDIECYISLFIYEAESDTIALDAIPVPSGYKSNSKPVIPRVIHYCWFGGNPIPKKNLRCIDSWRKFCPDYEIIEWNERNYDVKKHPYMAQAYTVKKWGFVPDYARHDIIHAHGGIYLDTDVELVKPLDELLYNNAYIGFDCMFQINAGSGCGAYKGAQIIREMRDYYDDISFINIDGTLNATPSPVHETKVALRHGLKLNGSFQVIDGMTIYPVECFCPKTPVSGKLTITKNTFSIHHFDASWLDNDKSEAIIANRELYKTL